MLPVSFLFKGNSLIFNLKIGVLLFRDRSQFHVLQWIAFKDFLYRFTWNGTENPSFLVIFEDFLLKTLFIQKKVVSLCQQFPPRLLTMCTTVGLRFYIRLGFWMMATYTNRPISSHICTSSFFKIPHISSYCPYFKADLR